MKPVQFISSQSSPTSTNTEQPLSDPAAHVQPIIVNKSKYMKLEIPTTPSKQKQSISKPAQRQTKQQQQFIAQNQYQNLILFDPGVDCALDQKSFQIISTSANKQKAVVKATFENVNGRS